MGLADDAAFGFTESRVEEAIRLVRSGSAGGKSDGRRVWRDSGDTHGLHLVVGKRAARYYRIAKIAGRRVEVRLGDATAMRVSAARSAALKLAGGDKSAAAAPIRVRTDGPTVAEAWAEYLADIRSGAFVAGRNRVKESTAKSYVVLYDAHLVRPFGKKSLHYLAQRIPELHKSLHKKPATANKLLQVLRNLYVHASKAGHWDKPNPTFDPVTGKVWRKYTVASRSRYLTTDEAGRVLTFAATEPDPWCDFWPLLFLSGVRCSTLREACWSHIDFTAGIWRVPTSKNGEALDVVLVDEAVRILRDRLERAPVGKGGKPASVWVFPMRDDLTKCISDLDHAWSRCRDAAGMEDVRIHDIRRTAGSWATQGGAPLTAVGKMLGHKSPNATAVYARSDTAAARLAAEIVESRLLTAAKLGGES